MFKKDVLKEAQSKFFYVSLYEFTNPISTISNKFLTQFLFYFTKKSNFFGIYQNCEIKIFLSLSVHYQLIRNKSKNKLIKKILSMKFFQLEIKYETHK